MNGEPIRSGYTAVMLASEASEQAITPASRRRLCLHGQLFGGTDFLGQEVVYVREQPIWAAYAKYVPRIGRKPLPMTVDYTDVIANHDIWLLCERENGKPVALVALENTVDAMLIYSIAIQPELQARGLGSWLMRLAEESVIVGAYVPYPRFAGIGNIRRTLYGSILSRKTPAPF